MTAKLECDIEVVAPNNIGFTFEIITRDCNQDPFRERDLVSKAYPDASRGNVQSDTLFDATQRKGDGAIGVNGITFSARSLWRGTRRLWSHYLRHTIKTPNIWRTFKQHQRAYK